MVHNNYSLAIMSLKTMRVHTNWLTREFINDEFKFFGNNVDEMLSLDLARIMGMVWEPRTDRFHLRM